MTTVVPTVVPTVAANPLDALPEPEAILRRIEAIDREKAQLKKLYALAQAMKEQRAAAPSPANGEGKVP